jgi:hypothetical protein
MASHISGETESLSVLTRQAELLKQRLDLANGLKRLVAHPDWKCFDELIARLSGEIIRDGKMTNDVNERSGCFEQLTAIGKINIAINNAINSGEETLRQYEDIMERLEKLSRKSA